MRMPIRCGGIGAKGVEGGGERRLLFERQKVDPPAFAAGNDAPPIGEGAAARGETIEGAEPKLPQPVRSVEPWREERIEREAERIRTNPTRLDRLRALPGFVQQETYATKHLPPWAPLCASLR